TLWQGNFMKKLNNKKFNTTALAMAVAVALPVVLMAPAYAVVTGSTTTEMTASLNVISDNLCTLTVTPPAVTDMRATWTGDTASNTSTMTDFTATEPLGITVVAEGGAACQLNGIKVVTQATNDGGDSGGNAYASKSFGASGGAWTYMPFLARAQFYTDADTQVPGVATITAVTSLDREPIQATPVNLVGTSRAVIPRGGPSAATSYLMADSYVTYHLATNAKTGDTTTFEFSEVEDYKSAIISMSARVGSDPVTPTGAIDRTLAANGDVVVMPFAVTITES
ncbi:hypothetical protein J1780_00265, partial [Rahnella aceris]|uniref:hypothetical protein n=1 Tax=Rahnella sp. (strain Y9602) TaxID=2703885 RepID=UPI001C2790D5